MPRRRVNYYKTPEMLSKARKEWYDMLKRDYRHWKAEYGEEYADKYFDWDAHCCVDFATNGGYCDICGCIVSGSPVDREEKQYDYDLEYSYYDIYDYNVPF